MIRILSFKRSFLCLLPAFALMLACTSPLLARADQKELPSASASKLPRWRGFNLDPFWKLDRRRPVDETEFQIISELGFNFVRLPMDYRIWIKDGDWHRIDETAFVEIDRAITFGEKYRIHINLNFHRAPGYTVTTPPEPASLWESEEAQAVCALHWAVFARRYKGIPNNRLSFNPLNEPGRIDPKLYARVLARIVEAIRREDPDRLIIADGVAHGTSPAAELIPLGVAQSTRAYSPMEITHYDAPWAWKNKKPEYPPIWPMVRVSSYLYSPTRSENQGPLMINGSFPSGALLRIGVGIVSRQARLVVKAGDIVLLDKNYVAGANSIAGEKVSFDEKNNVYRNDYSALPPHELVLPEGSRVVSLQNTGGDWLTLSSLALLPAPQAVPQTLPLMPVWGATRATSRQITWDPIRPDQPWGGPVQNDRDSIWKYNIVPWQTVQSQGVGVMVGEWGCFNRTPYETTMRWMEDNLANFQKAGWGWALWNLSGPFGILNSERGDVVYENYRGYKLDRRMLELLQRY